MADRYGKITSYALFLQSESAPGARFRARFLTRALARAEEATSLRICFLAVGLSAVVAAALASVLEQEYVDGAHVAGEGH